jgi:catechol 2,3-dioxygenase-like lactoylglutathione lyase family enzyme
LFDHVTIRASNREASEQFYETVLTPLEIEQTYSDEQGAEWDDFSLSGATEDKPVTRRLHVAFTAPSRGHVDEFWRAGTDAGYRDGGFPGLRPEYRDDYYGAFLRDPDGNNVEAVHHGDTRPGVDHLWLRVADVAASKQFYEGIAPHAGFRLKHESPNRAQFVGERASFSVVAGDPSEHVHIAFPVDDNAAVDAFHGALTGAGFRDNGPPGERPVYHDGYYAAFVLDPDGNNIELVNHNRPQ